jgi:hypothetical protein
MTNMRTRRLTRLEFDALTAAVAYMEPEWEEDDRKRLAALHRAWLKICAWQNSLT